MLVLIYLEVQLFPAQIGLLAGLRKFAYRPVASLAYIHIMMFLMDPS